MIKDAFILVCLVVLFGLVFGLENVPGFLAAVLVVAGFIYGTYKLLT